MRWLTGLALAGTVWTLAGQAHAAPPTLIVDQWRPFSGRALEVRRVWCQAPGRPAVQATMYLEDLSPFAYQVVRMEYNAPGQAMMVGGQHAPQLARYYQGYVVHGQPLAKVALNTLIGAWQLFGLKFDWEKATYRCQLS